MQSSPPESPKNATQCEVFSFTPVTPPNMLLRCCTEWKLCNCQFKKSVPFFYYRIKCIQRLFMKKS
jgi:hypothetical protein